MLGYPTAIPCPRQGICINGIDTLPGFAPPRGHETLQNVENTTPRNAKGNNLMFVVQLSVEEHVDPERGKEWPPAHTRRYTSHHAAQS